MELIEAEHPRPRHFLLHLSDPHLLGGSAPLLGKVDSDALLQQLFDEVRASGARPEAVIFTGDLADRGEAEAYAKLRAIVEPACKAMGAKVIWAMGNHDNRANFRTGLLDQPADDAPVDHTYFINGLRIITLDTSVPGFHHGELSPDQLEWLAAELATPPRTEPFWRCITRRCLRSWTSPSWWSCGTRRRWPGCCVIPTSGPFWAATCITRPPRPSPGFRSPLASATCYTQDLNVPVGGTRGRDGGQAFNLVHVYEHTIVHSVVLLGDTPAVGELVSAAETQRRISAAGIRIPGKAKLEDPARTPGHRRLTASN